jgi:hypothetical protein
MFGDALRDIFDPRLRRGLGRFGQMKSKQIRKSLEKQEQDDQEAQAAS